MNKLGYAITSNQCQSFTNGIEDYDTSICLNKNGVKLEESRDSKNQILFHPYSLLNHYLYDLPSWMAGRSSPVTFFLLFYFKEYFY
jgi:hypothetical protein